VNFRGFDAQQKHYSAARYQEARQCRLPSEGHGIVHRIRHCRHARHVRLRQLEMFAYGVGGNIDGIAQGRYIDTPGYIETAVRKLVQKARTAFPELRDEAAS
jgi:hypothetical protein